MSKIVRIRSEFVDRIPKTLQEGVIYISQKYSTAAHNCCCGCGVKIVTPLKPGRWSLELNGEYISLHPSIGNWSAACQSHYWIENNLIKWAHRYSQSQILANRISDKHALEMAHTRRQMHDKSLWARIWDNLKGWLSNRR